ncbi:tRNA delta(2)-isopentenylpyrophosphate transferase [Corynebacterium falsenii DSM 44353]|uniref:tRNA (adenosine(37)-N6)-dimethylallyltransferase MiaA n=1 Tax=Corynebacterium falsenii TaxID=108486 RepID=UPI0003E96AE1|nr:tRNA (adenosine(37)-N6)-dimethylallyltransferase MiaA [Corynebacterium falsenii]AHI03254.1 tRNA delta(2)-isopentenylpyrophosphate transferase [Corynebacterium falsenii DSM 44353]MDC7103422.1 tRNA (adenosine(37)-N6)-dimethylallyltransferase MiaA [Corynebacterium falsenii]UBI03950.1 tRNA (adenosine(37)-N6)-dimethylallyltransferase MiaA [Corynebacterium falsenii]UBI06038.1 tRNA (adenosine(37)-N6)-dimethylallyltransferase MiaA [Corynebacterium falsenii]
MNDSPRSTRPIAVVGPTASGKSAVSLALAEELSGEVVNIDSMQLYRGMDIGTAKLPVDERRGIPHHQLDVWDITKPASVAEYRASAVADVESIMNRGKRPIIVGGSMMYVQALVDEWDFPPTDPHVRARWEQQLDRIGVHALHDHLATVDPEAARIIERNDPRRTVRALEVIELTGRPFAASQPPKNSTPRWNLRLVGLWADADWLNPRIEQRVREMFDAGFVDEVRGLIEQGLVRESTAGKAIGYSQVLDYLEGECSLDEAIEATVMGTRRYARRQRSWFRRDPRIEWLDAAAPDVVDRALNLVRDES